MRDFFTFWQYCSKSHEKTAFNLSSQNKEIFGNVSALQKYFCYTYNKNGDIKKTHTFVVVSCNLSFLIFFAEIHHPTNYWLNNLLDFFQVCGAKARKCSSKHLGKIMVVVSVLYGSFASPFQSFPSIYLHWLLHFFSRFSSWIGHIYYKHKTKYDVCRTISKRPWIIIFDLILIRGSS